VAGGTASAAPLDVREEMQLGVRTYTALRIGTEQTDASIISDGVRQVSRSLTFPISSAGSMRQHRGFAEVELRHDLSRLLREGFGPLALLNSLPFKMKSFRYFIAYRGEFDGIYDYGPSEFRTAEQFLDPRIVLDTPFPDISPSREEIAYNDRTRLRDIGTVRNRLFQAYLQAQSGDVTVRFGRQILAWGETDIFRLLDNINPLDASFGGFLVSLDERRVPLDMLRTTWYLGDFSNTGIPGLSVLSNLPWYEAYLEGFVAIDKSVGFSPGVAKGSAWGPPNVNVPTRSILTTFETPSRTIEDARGGFQFRFSSPMPAIGDIALGAAHYFTYFDIPSVRIMSQRSPAPFPNPIDDPTLAADRYSIWAVQTAPRTRVTGIFGNFALPPEWGRALGITGEPIVRFETAYFKNEPRNSQTSVDPFVHALIVDNCSDSGVANEVEMSYRVDASGRPDPNGRFCTAGARTGSSWNVVLGLDLNQWIRFINPNSSIFITTQFFYRHLQNAEKRELIRPESAFLPGQSPVYFGEILPVQKEVISTDYLLGSFVGSTDAAAPNFVHSPVDQYLQTLLITSPYYGGRSLPSLGIFYDWSGAWVLQPSFTYSVDPFRFTVTYNFLAATDLKGGAGISLLRDRDNILFQIEYVI
jgi:hypothetical protein